MSKKTIKGIYENLVKDLEQFKHLDCFNSLKEIIDNNFMSATMNKRKRTKSDNLTIKDENGNIVAILDYFSKIYLPATEEFFMKDGVDRFRLGGMSRISRLSASIRQRWFLSKKKDINYLNECLKRGIIDETTFKDKLKEIEKSKPDYSELKKYEFKKGM